MANIIIAFIILLTSLVVVLLLRANYRSRRYATTGDYTVIVLKGINLNWPILITLILNLYITWSNNIRWPETSWNTSFCILAYGLFFLYLGELWMQQFAGRDRILLKKGEVLFISSRVSRLATQTIKEIKLNGLTEQITIKGNGSLSFSKNRITSAELSQVIIFLRSEALEGHLIISDNLIREISDNDNPPPSR